MCVGRPLGDAELRIIRPSSEPIERWDVVEALTAGEIGGVVASGSQVTARYFRNVEATRRAKIHEATAGGGSRIWHRMGDLGYLDDRGRLWFCGRLFRVGPKESLVDRGPEKVPRSQWFRYARRATATARHSSGFLSSAGCCRRTRGMRPRPKTIRKVCGRLPAPTATSWKTSTSVMSRGV